MCVEQSPNVKKLTSEIRWELVSAHPSAALRYGWANRPPVPMQNTFAFVLGTVRVIQSIGLCVLFLRLTLWLLGSTST